MIVVSDIYVSLSDRAFPREVSGFVASCMHLSVKSQGRLFLYQLERSPHGRLLCCM